MLKHILLISSIGFIAGWAMVKAELASRPLLAGCLVAGALIALYLALTVIVWLMNPFARRLRAGAPDDDEYNSHSLLGFDSRGDLRIESDYPQGK